MNPPRRGTPSPAATVHAAFGTTSAPVSEATSSASSSEASIPAISSARRPASTHMSSVVSPDASSRTRRSRMPVTWTDQ